MSLFSSRRPWSWLPLLAVAACNAPNGGGPTSDFPFSGGNGGGFNPTIDAGAQSPDEGETGGAGEPVGVTGSTAGGTGAPGASVDAGGFTPPNDLGDAGLPSFDASTGPECSPDAGPADAGPDAADADAADAAAADAGVPDAGEGGMGRTLAAHPNPCEEDAGGATDLGH